MPNLHHTPAAPEPAWVPAARSLYLHPTRPSAETVAATLRARHPEVTGDAVRRWLKL